MYKKQKILYVLEHREVKSKQGMNVLFMEQKKCKICYMWVCNFKILWSVEHGVCICKSVEGLTSSSTRTLHKDVKWCDWNVRMKTHKILM